jgi:hypothetical protein
MSDIFFKLVNPVVKALLQSPLHGLMSHNTVLLKFRGRTSGRDLSTPVSYRLSGDELQCFTSYPWVKNLANGEVITLVLKGKPRRGLPILTVDDPGHTATVLVQFLRAVPRDAPHAGVALDANGEPDQGDIATAASKLTLITIRLID